MTVKNFSGVLEYLPERLRIFHITGDTFCIIFPRISVFVQNRLIDQCGVSRRCQLRIVPDPLVQDEHFRVNLRKLVCRNHPAIPSAGNDKESRCRKHAYSTQTGHALYLNVAPKEFWYVARSLDIAFSTSLSVNVFSGSWSTKLRAYCFFPSGILSPL